MYIKLYILTSIFFIKFNLISNLPIVHLRKDKEAAKQVLLTDFRRDFQFSNSHPLYIFVCFLFNSFELDFSAQIQIKSYLISHSSPLKKIRKQKSFTHRFPSWFPVVAVEQGRIHLHIFEDIELRWQNCCHYLCIHHKRIIYSAAEIIAHGVHIRYTIVYFSLLKNDYMKWSFSFIRIIGDKNYLK